MKKIIVCLCLIVPQAVSAASRWSNNSWNPTSSLSASANETITGNWTFSGTPVFSGSPTFSGKLGLGGANSGTYLLELYPTDINSVLIRNTSSNVAIAIQANTNAYIGIDTNRNGGSNVTGQIKFQHNTGEIGHLEGDNACNCIRLDAGSTEQGKTGINIDSSHNIGIGADALSGRLSVSSATTSTIGLNFAGAFSTLPTSGYSEGTLAYQLSDHILYIATMTVNASNSWKATY